MWHANGITVTMGPLRPCHTTRIPTAVLTMLLILTDCYSQANTLLSVIPHTHTSSVTDLTCISVMDLCRLPSL